MTDTIKIMNSSLTITDVQAHPYLTVLAVLTAIIIMFVLQPLLLQTMVNYILDYYGKKNITFKVAIVLMLLLVFVGSLFK